MKIRGQFGSAILLLTLFGFSTSANEAVFVPAPYAPIGSPISIEESFKFFDVGDDFEITFDKGVPYIVFEQNAFYPELNLWTRYDSIDLLLETMNRNFKPLMLETGGYHYHFASLRSFKSLEADRVVFDFLGLIREYSKWSVEALDVNSHEPLKVKFVTADLVTMVGPITSVLVQSHGQFGSRNPWTNIEYLSFNVETNRTANLLDIVEPASLISSIKSDYYLQSLAKKSHLAKTFAAVETIDELDQILAKIFKNSNEPVSWAYDASNPQEQFKKFAIYDFNAEFGMMTVWIGLEYANENDNLQFRNLTLQVKPNAQFLKILRKVQAEPGNTLFRSQAKVRARYH